MFTLTNITITESDEDETVYRVEGDYFDTKVWLLLGWDGYDYGIYDFDADPIMENEEDVLNLWGLMFAELDEYRAEVAYVDAFDRALDAGASEHDADKAGENAAKAVARR